MKLNFSKTIFFITAVILLSSSIQALDNFNYRVPFNLTSSSSTLTDFQVMIVLNNSNINYSHTNEDGSDLRFTWLNQTSGEEQEIPYWIDEDINKGWDKLGNSYVWVKVPVIDKNGQIFYFYYGNKSNINSKSNASEVFIYHNLFDNLDGLIDVGAGFSTYKINEGELYYETNHMSTDEGNGKRTINSFDYTNLTLYAKIKGTADYDHVSLIALEETPSKLIGLEHYTWLYDSTRTIIGLNNGKTAYSLSTTTQNETSTQDLDWLIFKINLINANKAKFETMDLSYSKRFSYSTNLSYSIKNPHIIILNWNGGATGINKAYIDMILLTKSSLDNITQSFGKEEGANVISISFNQQYKLTEPFIVSVKNEGNENLTNVSVSTSFGVLNESFFNLLQPNEEKKIQLTYDNSQPQISLVRIKVESDQKNKTDEKVVVFYDEVLNNLTAEVNKTDAQELENVYHNFTLEFKNQNAEDHSLIENFKYYSSNPSSVCYENGNPLQTIDYANYFVINKTLAGASNASINCVLTSHENIFKEQAEEQDVEKQSNSTFAYTRVPLVFNNPFNSQMVIEWHFNKIEYENRTRSNTSGEFVLQSGETRKVYLEMNRSVNITLLGILNYSGGEVEPSLSYFKTYALMNISNNDSINYTNIVYYYENESYYESVEYINASAGNNTNKILVKINLTATEKEISSNPLFEYSKNKEIKMSHSGDFHVNGLVFKYKKGDWKSYVLYKCVYDNYSKCNYSDNSSWVKQGAIEENGFIKTSDNNNSMSDLTYVISYENNPPSSSPSPSSSGGGGGGGAGGYTPFNFTSINTSQEGSLFTVNIVLNRRGVCNYSINNASAVEMQGKDFNWTASIPLIKGSNLINVTCFYSLQKVTKTFNISFEPTQAPLQQKQVKKQQEDNLEEDKPIETSSSTGFIIGSGNFNLGLIVLLLALFSYYAYSKKEALTSFKLPKIKTPSSFIKKKTKKPKKEITEKQDRKVLPKESSYALPPIAKVEIKRKDIEANVNQNKPLAVQRICKFIKEDGKKINYTVSDLANALNLSLISTRQAINRGLALGIFEKYENGKFKAYRLGKYGRIIADLEVEIKTYSELETVVRLLKKREQEN